MDHPAGVIVHSLGKGRSQAEEHGIGHDAAAGGGRVIGQLNDEGGISDRDYPQFEEVPPQQWPRWAAFSGVLGLIDQDDGQRVSRGVAGIAKREDRGRTVDVHVLRHIFGTLLSKGGVSPRTAQAALRHCKIDLTMNVYVGPRSLDVAGAMETLPSLPLEGEPGREAIAVRATGTGDSTPSEFAPKFAPTGAKSCTSGSILDKTTTNGDGVGKAGSVAVTAYLVKRKDP